MNCIFLMIYLWKELRKIPAFLSRAMNQLVQVVLARCCCWEVTLLDSKLKRKLIK